MHDQPTVELVSGRVCAGEALLRWRHPEQGLLSAGTFVGIAEETGLIREIGEWVVQQMCADLRRWDHDGRPVDHVYVNRSRSGTGWSTTCAAPSSATRSRLPGRGSRSRACQRLCVSA